MIGAFRLSLVTLVTFIGITARAEPSGPDRGLYLARAANCAACHTTPDGQDYAGGLKMATPLGNISTTNITPDDQTGIGRYSYEDFARALRKGVAKDGHHLYPAMPYPSYAKMTDADLRALYGYFKTSVKPVVRKNDASEIKWPLNMRWPLAIWDIVFSRATPYEAKADKNADWNRGAYLVQGMGHCGACHTPRGIAFQEKGLDESSAKFLAGAMLDDWSAANLRGDDRTGIGRWTADDVAAFLKSGHGRFGSSFGTMNEVINSSTQYLDERDLAAIANYVKSLTPAIAGQPAFVYDPAEVKALADGSLTTPGAFIYWQKCGSCHATDGKGQGAIVATLAGNPSVMDPDPVSLINLVLNGSIPLVVSGVPDSYQMPQFRRVLNDQEIADVVSFIRQGWGNNAAPTSAAEVATVRGKTDFVRYKAQILRMQ